MPDPIYRSVVVTQVVNKILLSGKRSTAEHIVYSALKDIERKTGGEPVAVLKRAVENVRPVLEVSLGRLLLCGHGDDVRVALVALQLLGLGDGLVRAAPGASGLHHLAQPRLLLGEALDPIEITVGVRFCEL